MTTLKSIQYRPLSRVIWLFSSLLFFVGCGFQLKGSDTENGEAQLDGMTIQLISSRSRSELTREVSRALTAIGLVLVTDAEQEALLVLTLQPEQFSQRNVSLTAQARAAEAAPGVVAAKASPGNSPRVWVRAGAEAGDISRLDAEFDGVWDSGLAAGPGGPGGLGPLGTASARALACGARARGGVREKAGRGARGGGGDQGGDRAGAAALAAGAWRGAALGAADAPPDRWRLGVPDPLRSAHSHQMEGRQRLPSPGKRRAYVAQLLGPPEAVAGYSDW